MMQTPPCPRAGGGKHLARGTVGVVLFLTHLLDALRPPPALCRLRHAGCCFMVAGRRDTSTEQFMTLEDIQVCGPQRGWLPLP